MAKTRITKKILEENPSLIPLLTEKGYRAGDFIEQGLLQQFINESLPGDESKETIAEVEVQEFYRVVKQFLDIEDNVTVYQIGQLVPTHFSEERLQNLLMRGIIEKEE